MPQHAKGLVRRKKGLKSPWLSQPEKMPGYGFNLPAGRSCPAAKKSIALLGERAMCNGCYAMGGNYLWPNVKNSLEARFQMVLTSLREDNGDHFVALMVTEISRVLKDREKVFRIHDSGDFFSPAYVDAWYRVCERLPDVKFWAPTREWFREEMLPSLRRLATLPNVTIRPSALMVNEPAPVIEGLHAGSAVVMSKRDLPPGHKLCPASSSDKHHCDDHYQRKGGCRSCWTEKDQPKAYMAHGQRVGKLKRSLPVLET